MQPPSCYNESMSFFTSFAIVIAAMLIMIFLQLTPGVFALFYHYCLGKFNRPKASDFALFFFLGVEIISACLFLATYFIMSIFLLDNSDLTNQQLAWCFAGLFLALALFCLLFYYRRGKTSELFIPRAYATAIDHSAKTVKNRSGAFLLGLLSGSCELILILPLYIVVAIEILKIENLGLPANLLAITFVLVPIIPLFFLYWQYYFGYTLADIIKKRVKNKMLVRVALCLLFLTITIIIINAGVI